MQRLDDSVFEVACKDESAVVAEFFNETTKGRLSRIRI
jgi:hypothetical protein